MILAILQARTSSSRLPGKVLRPILGKPMLAHQIERVRRARMVDHLIVATSIDSSDDSLAQLCEEIGVPCFRGSLDNVLDRFYQAAKEHQPETVVRLTGDCPLADPEVIDHVIRFYLDGNFDYAGNCLEATYPDGLDAEVFSFAALERAWNEAELPSQKEHVTLYVNRQPDKFRIGHVKREPDLSALRWTVDEPRDLEFVTEVYRALYPANPKFTTDDILDLLRQRPELMEINSDITRNEGLAKSLELDQTK